MGAEHGERLPAASTARALKTVLTFELTVTCTPGLANWATVTVATRFAGAQEASAAKICTRGETSPLATVTVPRSRGVSEVLLGDAGEVPVNTGVEGGVWSEM